VPDPVQRPRPFRPSLAGLVSPIAEADFLSRHWETAPLHVVRGRADYFARLLTRNELEFLITSACQLDSKSVELLSAGMPKRIAPDAAALAQLFADGSTIRLMSVERLWRPLAVLCAELEQRSGFPVRANLYASPPESRGLPAHFDRHSVFVLQVSGEKRWKIYDAPLPAPLDYVPPMLFEDPDQVTELRVKQPGDPEAVDYARRNRPRREVVLRPGDTLYLPRGHIHEARTTSEPSVHLSIGVYAPTVLDLVTTALTERAHKDVNLREALPFALHPKDSDFPRRLDATVDRFLTEADWPRAFQVLSSILARNHEKRSRSLSMARPDSRIGPSTRLRRRRGLLCRVNAAPDRVLISFSGKTIEAPPHVEPELRFVARGGAFRADSLPGSLDRAGRLLLARRLFSEGLLETLEGPDRT
jgi:ribosomal protein L16 Arg81 hydroxylase